MDSWGYKNQIDKEWSEAIFPFDFAECGNCITQHSVLGCDNPKHKELLDEARALDLEHRHEGERTYSPEFKAAVLALRVKYASLFPDAIPERT